MTNSKLARLLALSDSEYRRTRGTPTRQRFKALKVNLSNLDTDWERQRGAAVRLAGTVLSDDSETLLQKISASPEMAATFSDALGWLRKEATVLRKTAGRLDVAVTRLSSVMARHRERQEETASTASTEGGSAKPPSPTAGVRDE